MSDETYNGWTNKPTWCMSMYLDGNYTGEARCRETEALVQAAAETVTGPGPDPLHGARVQLREALQDSFVNDEKDAPSGGIAADLYGWAVAMVDWWEIACAYLSNVEDEVARS